MPNAIFFVVIISIALSGGCAGAEAVVPAQPPTRYVIFGDASLSVGPEQAQRWCAAADALVFDRLRPGDAVLVFAATDRTAETAPFFDAVIPGLGEDGMDAEMRVRKTLAAAREKGLDAVRQALTSPVRSRETRLLESLTRIPRDSSRRTRVLYLTDAKESSPDLDLERTRLTNDNLVPLAQAAAARYGWTRGMLRGVSVRFVLDSPPPNSKRSVNERRMLERFWRALLRDLEAELTTFDSRITEQ